MKGKIIIRSLFTLFFILYGLMGILGRGPISPNAVLATYMVLYFGHVYVPSIFGFFDINKKDKE